MAGTLLTTTAVTTMVPVVYADDDHKDHDKDNHDKKHDGKDGDGNKAKAEDDSITQLIDCDDNEQEAENSLFPAVCVAEAFIGEP